VDPVKQLTKSEFFTMEMHEGILYQRAMDVTGCSAESAEEIPTPLQPVVQNPLSTRAYTRIYFDLKTMDLVCVCHIYSKQITLFYIMVIHELFIIYRAITQTFLPV
jgi:hypothetical protein